ncbi:MAG: hypothetical protein PVJ52_02215 [Candidatus Woesebacteria bacterium]
MTKKETLQEFDLGELNSKDLDRILNTDGLPEEVYLVGDKKEFFNIYKPKYEPEASEYTIEVTPESMERITSILEE